MPLVDMAPNIRTKSNEVVLDYEPEPRQSQFHLSPAKYRLYIGAWRAGKTYAGCWEAVKQSLCYPNNMGLVGRKDYSDLRDTTIKTFFEVCPERIIQNYNKSEHILKFINGSCILFRELKDRSGLGSLELGWWYIDEGEEAQFEIFQYLQGRLSKADTRRCGWITSNPPNENHWIHKVFEEEQKNNKDYFTVHASTYENKDNLPEGYIESLEAMPTSWRKKYLEGQYGFTPDGDPFYQGYVEHVHRFNIPVNPQVVLDCGWDFGFRHPAFVVTQKQGNTWVILDEILGSDTTLEKFIVNQVFPLLEKKYKGLPCRHFGDPAAMQRTDKSEHTSWQILMSHGVRLMCKQSEYRLRKEIIERLLASLDKGRPQLAVCDTCRIVNDGFMGGYHYPVFKGGAAPFGYKAEVPERDGFYEHIMNALEYVAIHLFSPAVVLTSRSRAQNTYYARQKQAAALRHGGDNI